MTDPVKHTDDGDVQPTKKRVFVALLPLIIFAALAGIFTWQLLSGKNMQEIPSALIGRDAPQTDLPPLEGLRLADGSQTPGLKGSDLKGQVTLVNIWASWCVPCRDEHPLIVKLGQDPRIKVVGLNYKDAPENALEFLNSLGNPYDVVGTDRSGRAGIEWGVYGVPETFIVNREGKIVYKFVGPLSTESLIKQFMPEVEKALAQ
ncbi:DsbE family thiol:disulfide interchange protein [Pseudochrobactrum kiredjianiae]|uniref:DsbE family thiol:disulfide interchange protein n=1 Tax=Pseudochrobactrum kiredjianiae TaxID=386305 RepID=A0ABW3V851_9HYPH|nr:DsbE family thiol:disulfide interchange protein [Pseudochrobactrum kiredjianiae]MDM7849760.1 DsbE family thiol:disulfide interchange protein [Pseudochrobactrum kiredjianiae]